jgi:hypothetical protein
MVTDGARARLVCIYTVLYVVQYMCMYSRIYSTWTLMSRIYTVHY